MALTKQTQYDDEPLRQPGSSLSIRPGERPSEWAARVAVAERKES